MLDEGKIHEDVVVPFVRCTFPPAASAFKV